MAFKKAIMINFCSMENRDNDDNNSALNGEMGYKNLKGCLIVILFFGLIYILGKIFNV